MKGEYSMANYNTRSTEKSVKTVSFRLTQDEWEALKILAIIDGTQGVSNTAREETLKAIHERVPQDTLERLAI